MSLPGFTLLLPLLLPLIGGVGMLAYRRVRGVPFGERGVARFAFVLSLANSLIVCLLLLADVAPLRATMTMEGLSLIFLLRMDGLGRFFAGLVALLWPLATLYASEYMESDTRPLAFFFFYLLSYGVTLGVCFAGNLFTLYIFYEFLTLSTIPLVLHGFSAEHRRAARKYAIYSVGGAALALTGIIVLLYHGYGGDFTYGGIVKSGSTLYTAMYIVLFLGLSVKAAVFPFHGWLPTASVAPTPVTALLHAVAVVKAGVFAVMRITFYVFDPTLLRGTMAQKIPLVLVLATVVIGAVMAVRERHFKRRLAYSTVSNLSYVLTGVLLLTPAGFAAGLCHMAFHAITKITAFFCAGAVKVKTGREYLFELEGLGRVMPKTFALFTVSALSLTGVPLFCCFVSKFSLLEAALSVGTPLGYAALAALLVSALLCAVYMLTVVIRAFFPKRDGSAPLGDALPSSRADPSWRMLLPALVCALLIILCGIFPGPMLRLVSAISIGGG